MSYLYLDFETRSSVNIHERSLDRYLRDRYAAALMLAWAVNDEEPQLWFPGTPIPARLHSHLLDSTVRKVAWNAPFEYNVFDILLGIHIPFCEWIDAMIWARHLSLPGKLGECCAAMGLPDDEAKDADGKRLIRMFTIPFSMGGDQTLFGVTEPYFLAPEKHSEDWTKFCEYCKQDVVAERAIFERLLSLPLPEIEQRGYELDQRINARGIPTHMALANAAYRVALKCKASVIEELKTATKLENPNSTDQLLPWLKEQGYPYGSLNKNWVSAAINKPPKTLTPLGLKVLKLRVRGSKSSYTKLAAIALAVSDDGRLRNQFNYLGASRTGRWSGKNVQLQNLPRPDARINKHLEEAIAVVLTEDTEKINAFLNSLYPAPEEPPSILVLVASLLRSMFIAPDGYNLGVVDASAIENRVLGWLAEDEEIAFANSPGRDPYKEFAAAWFGVRYEDVTKEQRQMAKAAVLGCGYGLGGGEEYPNKYGDIVKGGLWGYAENMGVKMTKKEAHEAVKAYRRKFYKVKDLWKNLENAAMDVIVNGGQVFVGCVRFDRKMRQDGTAIMRIFLPSGRYLHYINARIENRKKPWKNRETGEDVYGPSIVYDGIGHGVSSGFQTTVWGPVGTYGGKLAENIVQAISRDILLDCMFRMDADGLEIVAHVHDEVIVLLPDNPLAPTLEDLNAYMAETPWWAVGLNLGAAGYIDKIYHKD